MKDSEITSREIARREWELDEQQRNLIERKAILKRELEQLSVEQNAIHAKRQALQEAKARLKDSRADKS